MVGMSAAEVSLMKQDFIGLLQQNLIIERWVGQDIYAQSRYLPPSAYRCRVSPDQKMIKNTDGQEVASSAKIFIDSTVQIDLKDRLILPDGRVTNILAISRIPDERGDFRHQVIYI